jgi:hypothetical protein
MSETKTFTSAHFPYIPVTVVLNKRTETVEALLDTGFDGDLIIPEGMMTNGKPPDSYLRFTLADQATSVLAPAYLGRVEVAELGNAGEPVKAYRKVRTLGMLRSCFIRVSNGPHTSLYSIASTV